MAESMLTEQANRNRIVVMSSLLWAVVPAAHSQRSSEPPDLQTRASRNVVVIYDADKAAAKSYLGSGVLLQRDKALTDCRLLKAAKRVGVSQGARRSPARVTNHDGALCELEIAQPVHFNPLPLEIRPVDDVSVGDAVYAARARPGQDVALLSATVAGVRDAGDSKSIRISRKLTNAYRGTPLLDESGALIGIHRGGTKKTPDLGFIYPSTQLAQEVKADPIDTATAAADEPTSDVEPPAASEALQPPKVARVEERFIMPPDPADVAYKQAVNDFLSNVVKVSTKNVVYPQEARKARWTGTTSVWFRLNSGGEFNESFVDATSGYATLDVAALLAVRKAIGEIPLPPLIKQRGMIGTVAVTFALSDRTAQ